MVAILVEGGADVDAQTADGVTPLHCAAKMGHSRAVRELLDRGADPSVADKAGQLAAQVAGTLAVFHAIVEGTEVAKLRARIGDMRDEIGSLRGMVEALREENESLRVQAEVLHEATEGQDSDLARLWRDANLRSKDGRRTVDGGGAGADADGGTAHDTGI